MSLPTSWEGRADGVVIVAKPLVIGHALSDLVRVGEHAEVGLDRDDRRDLDVVDLVDLVVRRQCSPTNRT